MADYTEKRISRKTIRRRPNKLIKVSEEHIREGVIVRPEHSYSHKSMKALLAKYR